MTDILPQMITLSEAYIQVGWLVPNRWGLGLVRGAMCMKVASGIELEPWLGWVPVGMH